MKDIATKGKPVNLYVMAYNKLFVYCKDFDKGDEFEMRRDELTDLYTGVIK